MKKNTLNIHAPTYNLYYSTRPLREDEMGTADAVENLENAGQIVPFAKSPRVAPRFEGHILLDYRKGNESLTEIRKQFAGLKPDILAMPEIIIADPETTTINEEQFYIVPKGLIAFYITLNFSVKGELSDALCALRLYKEEQNVKDEERRKIFEEEN